MRLNQVTLPVHDLAQVIPFYESLGLRLIVLAEPHYARFETATGETLSLHKVDGALPPPKQRAMIYFEVDDVDDAVTKAEAAGLVFGQAPIDQKWLWREARLTDPAGNPVCLFHAGENRRFPPWRIGARNSCN